MGARDVEHKIDRGQTIDPGRKFKFSEVAAALGSISLPREWAARNHQALAKIEKLLGHRRLIELKAPTFIDFCKTREQEGAGPATILQDLSYVGTVLRHGGCPHWRGARRFHGNHRTRRRASHSSPLRARRKRGRAGPPTYRRGNSGADRVLVANPRRRIPMIDLMLFAIASAMRLGEIVSLRWEDLDEKARVVLIRARKHPRKKAADDRRVPLPLGPCVIGGNVVDPLQVMLRQSSAWRREGRIFPPRRPKCLESIPARDSRRRYRRPALSRSSARGRLSALRGWLGD